MSTGSPEADILLIAPDGMLGRAWSGLLAGGRPYRALRRAELDLARPESVAGVRVPEGGLVVNCAAYTDVDGAEREEALANRINGEAVGELARRCREGGASLLHYSTDYVFNGRAHRPYATDQAHDPVNAYGRSKALGETLLREAGGSHLVVRASWLYAPWGKNFVRTIAAAARQRESLRVVDDQRGRPSSCEHLAAASLALWQAGARGTRHLSDGGECSWYEFAEVIAAHANPRCRVEPCRSEEFPRPAARPAYSVLDLSASEAEIGPMPDWRDNLAAVLPRLEAA